MRKKIGTSFRLTPEALRLLAAVATSLGISQASWIEMVVRDFAKRNGVK